MGKRGRAWHRGPEYEISRHVFLSLKAKMYLTLDTLLVLKLGQLEVHCSVIISRAWLNIITMSYAGEPVLDLQLYVKKKKKSYVLFSLNYYPSIIMQQAMASFNLKGFGHSCGYHRAWSQCVPSLYRKQYGLCEIDSFTWCLLFLQVQNIITTNFFTILWAPWDLTFSALLPEFPF